MYLYFTARYRVKTFPIPITNPASVAQIMSAHRVLGIPSRFITPFMAQFEAGLERCYRTERFVPAACFIASKFNQRTPRDLSLRYIGAFVHRHDPVLSTGQDTISHDRMAGPRPSRTRRIRYGVQRDVASAECRIDEQRGCRQRRRVRGGIWRTDHGV